LSSAPLTVLCVATYEKGQEFIRECRRLGCRVLLLTEASLRDADWPRDAIDATFYLERDRTTRDDLLKGVSFVARTEAIDRIVPLDDFDVELAALLREHLRIPGMGETTARHFRDKLAMRVKARDRGLRVPRFVHVLNHDAIRRFADEVAPPWFLKPRSQASAVGIRRVEDAAGLWAAIDALGDQQSFYVLEQFVAGDIYHVDAIVSERQVVFAEAHKYGQPPWDVAHRGGIFSTRTIRDECPETAALQAFVREVVTALGLVRGVTHTEFIRAQADGQLYFLETSARVGGAHIADVVEAATGVNLWREWARIEVAGECGRYEVPTAGRRYAGVLISLARQEHPDLSAYDDPEVVRRLEKRHHAGLLLASDDGRRVQALLDGYARRFVTDFMASLPAPERPAS